MTFILLFYARQIIANTSPTPTPCDISPTDTIYPTATASPEPTTPQSPTPVPQPTYIYISEVMVDSATGEPEWIEFYNDENYDASLQNWKIDDIENGGSAPRTFSLDIPAKEYRALDLTSSMFNNDADQARLLDPLGTVIDAFTYTGSQKNMTWARDTLPAGDFCIQTPTKNAENEGCSTVTPTPTSVNTPSPTRTPTPIPTRTFSSAGLMITPTSPVSTPSPGSVLAINSSVFSTSISDIPPQPTVMPIISPYSKREPAFNSPHKTNKGLILNTSFTSLFFSLSGIVSIFLKMRTA